MFQNPDLMVLHKHGENPKWLWDKIFVLINCRMKNNFIVKKIWSAQTSSICKVTCTLHTHVLRTDFLWVCLAMKMLPVITSVLLIAGTEGCSGHGASAAREVHISAEWN
jgi:hypothetical protein